MSAGQAKLYATIAGFEGQRARIGDTNVDRALAPINPDPGAWRATLVARATSGPPRSSMR